MEPPTLCFLFAFCLFCSFLTPGLLGVCLVLAAASCSFVFLRTCTHGHSFSAWLACSVCAAGTDSSAVPRWPCPSNFEDQEERAF